MQRWNFLRRPDTLIGGLVSLALIVGAWQHWLPVELGLTEVFGFVTGGICVWLTVKENVWNWPVGIANDVFFVVLFLQSRLYADMSLQVVYIVLGVLGWYWWLHGGDKSSELPIANSDALTLAVLAGIVVVATAGMTLFLQHTHDVAPFWDALTTTLSLAAQYLLTRKLIENWYVWIVADLLYIPLYVWKGLYLTAILYGIFLCMCVAGLAQWRKALAGYQSAAFAT